MWSITNELDTFQEIEDIVMHESGILKEHIDKNDLKFMNINIRSINKNFDELMIQLQDIDFYFDVIVLTECWIKRDFIPKNIDGYHVFFTLNNRLQNDGVVMYVKADLDVVVEEIEFSQANTLNAKLRFRNDLYNILAVYRSPSHHDITDFLADLSQFYDSIVGQKCVCLGDFNINTLPPMHHQLDDYLNVLSEFGMRMGIKSATRENMESITCIDHIIVSNFGNPLTTIVFQTAITDHYMTIIAIKHNYELNDQVRMNNRIGKSVYMEGLKNDIAVEKWESVFNSDETNVAYENFIEILQNLIMKNTNIYRLKRKLTPIKPWITRGLIRAIRTRDSLNRRRKINNNDLELAEHYRRYRNCLNLLIKKTKIEYFKQKIDDAGNDLKKTWSTIREATDTIQKKKPEIDRIDIHGNIISMRDNSNDVLEFTNNHFASVGRKMAESIMESLNKTLPEIVNSCISANRSAISMFLTPVDEHEILSIIGTLRTSSSPGLDRIDNKIVKIIKNYITKPLMFIFNMSFEQGTFPSMMKKVCVRPLFKSGDRIVIGNYRPISLVSNISKILEKLMKKRLIDFLERNELLSSNQYGFRVGRSTEDAIFRLSKFVTDSLDSNKKCLAVFLDLAKAFDSVSHELLCKKLESIGIRGIVLEWFKSYLHERAQSVKIGDKISQETTVEYGVPQGTVLGPILYLVFANELCSLDIKGEMVAFADDTAIMFQEEDWNSLFNLAESQMRQVMLWLNKNLLTLNIEKTKFLAFSLTSAQKPQQDTLKLHNCTQTILPCNCPIIDRVDQIKYLGIVVDDLFRWDKHVSYIVTKLRKLVYIFVKLRQILPAHKLRTIYYALVESIVRYGILVWGGTYHNHVDPLIKVQKLLLKIICYRPRLYPTEQLFKEYKVLSVRQLYIYTVLIFIKTNPHLTRNVDHAHNTRSRDRDLYIVRRNTTFGQKSALYIGCKIFNLLPAEIIGMGILKFKKSTKSMLISIGNNDSEQLLCIG